jgi:preprotein translocase subunit SecA
MSDFLGNILKKIFGSASQRYVKSSQLFVQKVNELEPVYEKLSDAELRAKTDEFKQKIEAKKQQIFRDKSVDDLLIELHEVPEERRKSLKKQIISGLGECAAEVLPEAFAAVREAGKRRLGMRHFNVQMIGGRVLHEGKIAEMATGEGKTLVATLPCYINALLGFKVHVVSVNDYLVKRDRDWMAPVHELLGLTVGAIQSGMDSVGEERRQQYLCDISYGTNNELGFDYLRDNMKVRKADQVQGPLHYAIIDEVDSILIDEARTPLIISGPARDDVNRYRLADRVARVLVAKQQAAIRDTQAYLRDHLAEQKRRAVEAGVPESKVEEASRKFAQDPTWLTEDEAAAIGHKIFYIVERDRKSVHMTHDGITVAQEEANIGSFYVGANMEWPHLIENSLRAHVVYEHDKEYVVQEGEIIIVDEFTGRLMIGRQWSDGLHQAVEAKENVRVKEETQTLATITIQNYFKLYCKLAGMTGTAMTELDEFMKIYNLDVTSIPTNRPINRQDHNDRIYRTMKEKYNAIVDEVRAISIQGFPDDPELIEKLLEALRHVYAKDAAVSAKIDQAFDTVKNDEKAWPVMRDLLVELTQSKTEFSLPGGRPVLVGTTSVENSEKLSTLLTRRFGIEHEVLNAKNHAREAEIVAKAGHRHDPKHNGNTLEGNVTIATNMAGRGTDIKLQEGVIYPKCIGLLGAREPGVVACKCCIHCPEYDGVCADCFKPKLDPRFPELGRKFCTIEPPCGLHIVGTERHESRRIDNQLRGRAGRQGDPGSSRFFLSLEDDLLRFFAGEWVLKMLDWLGMEEGMAIENKRISNGIERAQKKVEERNFSVRKNLLEYDEVMDYQRQVFYRKRQQILDGRNLDRMIWEMIEESVDQAVDNFLDDLYPATCVSEWAKSALGINIAPQRLILDTCDELEYQLKEAAKDEARSIISLTIGEYLDPDVDRKDWDYRGLAKWAMSRFNVSLSITNLGKIEPEEIEENMLEAALEKIDQFDCAPLQRCIDPNYARSMLAEWTKNKFTVDIRLQDVAELNPGAIKDVILKKVRHTYHRREIEFPIEFQLSHTLLSQDKAESVYSVMALIDWVNHKFNAGWTPEYLQNKDLNHIRGEMVALAEDYFDNGKLEKEIDQALAEVNGDTSKLAEWAKQRFFFDLNPDHQQKDQLREKLITAGRSFLRSELTRLEEFVLINICDSVWKEHLLSMDHLKGSIGLRGYAEKDPKIEYKREGTKMFHRMLDTIREQVTDLILKVQITSGGSLEASSRYQQQQAQHADARGSFTESDRQAAMQQQGEGQVAVKTIRRDTTKAKPNDPCPCGSGKKYKKCCGRVH